MLRVNHPRPLASILLAATLAVVLAVPVPVSAELLQSTHFRLDPNVAGTFGGASESGSYKLTDVGGEAAVGIGSSQSYKLGEGYVRQLPRSLQLTVLPSGTYAYWPLDTGTGTRGYDGGVNANDATLIGAPAWTTGMLGQAVTLNGSSQYVATSKTQVNPTAFTIEFWFRTTTSTGGYLMGFSNAQSGAGTNIDRLVYMTNTGQLTFGTHPATYRTITTNAGYNDGSWHHVAASLGSGGLLLYVDGIKQGADPATTTAANYTGYWRLGYDNLAAWPSTPTSHYFAGTIDEARVLTRQLTDTEVQNDYTSGANALHNAFTLPNITPGQSQTYLVDAIVRTDAGGYDLYVQRPRPLTHTADGSTTIPDLASSIAAPAAWAEGTTKGFGFTLTAGTSLEAKWGSSPNYNYAALPSAATIYHSRTGLTGGAPESTTIQYRADTAAVQRQGTYATTVIYTATFKP